MKAEQSNIRNTCCIQNKHEQYFISNKHEILNRLTFFLLLFFVFVVACAGYAQTRNSTLLETENPKNKKSQTIIGKRQATLQLATSDTNVVSVSFPVLPLEIMAVRIQAKEVSVDILKIVSETNTILPLKYTIEPQIADIYPQQSGKVFAITFDTLDLKSIEAGLYTIFILAVPKNQKPVMMQVHFQLKASKKSLSFISGLFKRIKNDIISVVWTFIEIIFFVIIIGLMVWLIRLAFRGRNSLSVLTIVNETGKSGEMDGIASGIDDILLNCLQDIREKSKEAQVIHLWLTDTDTSQDDRSVKKVSDTQLSGVTGGGVPVDLHKLGDISIGPVKIPIGTIVSYVTKLFGGNYVTGALQQYGPINKIVLKLEKRPMFYKQNPQVRFFEVTWPSETIKINDLAEGVPKAIEELGYLITLNITDGIGTNNWIAYKNFLDGIICFKDYEANNTRKERLMDAIFYWREGIREDPYFAKDHYNLGVALDLLKQYEDALFRYQKAISLDEQLIGAEAHYNIAKLYRDVYKDDLKTLEELGKAENLNPNLSIIYNLKGLVYQARQENKTAVELYQKAIDLCKDDDSPIFYYNQSVAYYFLEDYDLAKAAGEKVLKYYQHKVENQPDILQTMGLIYIMKKEYNNAIPYFEQGLQLEPENYDMIHGYAIALREGGQLDKAIVMHRREIRLWPGRINAYVECVKTLERSGNWKKEAEIYNKLISLFSSDEFKDAWKFDKADQLMLVFDDSLEANKNDPECFSIFSCVLGSILYYLAKEYKNAVKYFQLAFPDEDTEPEISYLTRPDYLNTFGLSLAKYSQSIENDEINVAFNQALDRLYQASILYDEAQTYTLAKCFNDLGDVYKKVNNYELADKSYISSANYFRKLNLYIQASDAHVKSAECLMEWSRSLDNITYYKAAREECNTAISIDSTNYNAFHIKGLNYYNLRMYTEAIPQFEKAIEINYYLLGAQYNLGLCFRYTGNYKMASQKFKTIIRLERRKDSLEADYLLDPYEQLVICNAKLDKLDESEKFLKEAVDLFPSRVRCLLMYGDILIKQKLFKQAASIFDSAITKDPENKQKLLYKALNSLADLYSEQGVLTDKAFTMARDAMLICKSHRIYPNPDKEYLAKIRGTLGWIFYQKGDYKKAAHFLEYSIIHQLDDVRLYAHLAETYQKLVAPSKGKQRLDYIERSKRLWDQVIKFDIHKEWEEIGEKQLGILKEL